jgi:hypothetical protein
MRLEINRQYLEDLSKHFLPYMIMVCEANLEGTDSILYKLSKSILTDIDIIFKRKLLTVQKKFCIKMKDAEGLIFKRFMLEFPIPSDHFWRNNLRNQIILQLDKQSS